MLHRAPVALVAVLALVGCASSVSVPAPANDGPCTDRSGAYLARWVERSGGTCGPLSDSVVLVKPGNVLDDPNCKGTLTADANNCKAHGTVTCTGGVTETLTCNFAADASNGSCVISVDGGRCFSTYDVTLTKQ